MHMIRAGIVRIVSGLGFVWFLASCGVVSDRSNEYVTAQAGQQLNVPEWLSTENISPLYPIPSIENNRSLPSEYQVPEPPDATAVLDVDPYKIESLGEKVWLKLYTSPGKVWPLLDFFWRENDVSLASQHIAEGDLLTETISPNRFAGFFAQTEEGGEIVSLKGDSAFKVHLQQGVRRNTAELHIEQVPSSNAERSLDVERAVLNLIGSYITSDEVQNRYSLLANDIGTESRVRMLEEEGVQFLELDLPFDRAWNEIDQALKSANVIVADLDRTEGKFFVSYFDEEELGSWFDSEADIDSLRKERNYVVHLKKLEDGVIRIDVMVLNPDIEASKLRDLLNVVFEHIS